MKKLLILSIAMLLATAAYAALTPTQIYNVYLQDANTSDIWAIKSMAKQIEYKKAQVDARNATMKTFGLTVTPVPWGTTTLDLQNLALPVYGGFGT